MLYGVWCTLCAVWYVVHCMWCGGLRCTVCGALYVLYGVWCGVVWCGVVVCGAVLGLFYGSVCAVALTEQ